MSNNPFTGADIPQTIYKFREWDNSYNRRVLNGELYFASPLDFNDPFDCNISIAFKKLQNNPTLQQEYFTQVVNRQKPHFTQEQKAQEVKELISEGRFNDPAWLKWTAKHTREQMGRDFGVCCFSKVKDNILLWSYYSDSHRGFCVGFKSETLFNECVQQHVSGGHVNYQKDYPEIDPRTDLLEQLLTQIFYKSDYWCYEREYRLTMLHGSRQVVKISKDCYAEVILGCEMPETDRLFILAYLKAELPNVPVYQANTKGDKFELDFVRIN